MWPGQKKFIFFLASKLSWKNVSTPFSFQGFFIFLRHPKSLYQNMWEVKGLCFQQLASLKILCSEVRVPNSWNWAMWKSPRSKAAADPVSSVSRDRPAPFHRFAWSHGGLAERGGGEDLSRCYPELGHLRGCEEAGRGSNGSGIRRNVGYGGRF